ncbi:MAG: outer membrane beta-barrel protein [Flavobacteriales bacterium]
MTRSFLYTAWRRPVLFLCLLVAPVLTQAQGPGRGAGAAMNGRVYGKVIDAGTRKPAEFATVTVYRKDSLLGGTIVRNNGDFSVDKLPLGPLRVVVSFIGYTPLEQQVILSRERSELDLGNISLQPDQQLLQEVEVVGERNTMVMQVDRRVFNVDKDLTTQGGSGVDVMKNIPGLSVDVDGNVEMRGSNPQLLVDGRPTTITLDQLPAEEIERVEVITNPSVAFDASSTGGIINVVLKKNTKPGYSGQVQAGVGSNDRYQGGLNLNLREGRLGLNLSYNYNTSRNVTDGRTLREDLLNGNVLSTFEQNSTSSDLGRMQGGRFGIDYQLNNRNIISVSQNLRFRDREGGDEQRYSNEDLNGELINYGAQLNGSDMNNASYTTQLAWRHQGPEGREWTADVNYNRWDRDSRSLFELFGYGSGLEGLQRAQENIGGSDLHQIGGQLDVVRPKGSNKLEWGVKGSYKQDHTWLYVSVLTPPSSVATRDTALSNDYDITDIVNAAYVNWSRKLTERWSMQAGLRFEQTWFVTELRGKDQTFSYKYPNGGEDLVKALFPGLYLSRKWDGSMRELQVNFSRKIQRPRFWQIMPFIMFSDARNLRIGNPTISPEFSNIAEINHLLPFMKGKASWFTSLYGRFTEDVITGFSAPLENDSTILLNTFVNGSFSTSAGWEHVVKVEPFPKFQVTLSGSLRYTNIALANTNGGTRNEGFNWETKLLMAYRFGGKANWNAQVNGEYESPEIQPQGRTLSQYGIDASLGHDLTRKLSAVVSVNDVFFTRRWGNILETPFFYQENFRRREMRFVRFTLTWKFGEQNASLFRRRGEQQRREPGSGGGGDIDM